MPIDNSRLNEMVTDIKNDMVRVNATTETWINIQNYLGNDLSSDPNPTNASTTGVTLSWGAVSNSSVETNNSPNGNNAINFTIKENLTARTVIFTSGTDVTGVMELVSPISAGSKGAGLYLEYIKISLSPGEL